MTDLMTTISAALTRRGFTVHHAATKEEAARLVLSLIPEGASVGAGGSMTIRELALAETLQAAGHAVHWHWLEAGAAAFSAAHAADVYLASANAVTLGTPCGLTGKCDQDACPGGFCNVITVQERPTGKRPYHVVLVDEALGY